MGPATGFDPLTRLISLLPRPTVRLRLTLLFVCQFLVAAGALLALTWFLFQHQQGTPTIVRAVPIGSAPSSLPQKLTSLPVTDEERHAAVFARQIKESTLHQLQTQALEALAVIAIAAVAVGWWVAGRVLRPLHRVTATARRLSDESLHERIRLEGPRDEMKELGDTLDAMLDRLESAFASQRRFVASASHELRTPLTVQRALVDVVLADRHAGDGELRAALAAVRQTVDEQEGIIDGLLTLARSERGLERPEPVELELLVRRALTRLQPEAADRGIRIETALGPATLLGERTLLERMMGNLLENAIRHNQEGGSVWLETTQRNGLVLVEIANTGEAVPAEFLPRIFEPFARLAERRSVSREGLGLGLSIVRAVAVAHGGQVTAVPRRGGGLRFVVVLPGATATPPRSRVEANAPLAGYFPGPSRL